MLEHTHTFRNLWRYGPEITFKFTKYKYEIFRWNETLILKSKKGESCMLNKS